MVCFEWDGWENGSTATALETGSSGAASLLDFECDGWEDRSTAAALKPGRSGAASLLLDVECHG